MFSFFKKKRIGGEIAYYGLQDWWLYSFTPEEQSYIVNKFQPLGMTTTNSLIKGSISWSSQSVVSFLQSLSGWFNNPKDRHIAIRILQKAEQLSEQTPISDAKLRIFKKETILEKLSTKEADRTLDKHFLYHQQIKTFYRERNSDPNALNKTIEACQKQISLAPLAAKAFRRKWKSDPLPAHTGYEQLAIILEKQKNYHEALKICKEALKTKWNGDWERRLERLDKKLKKNS